MVCGGGCFVLACIGIRRVVAIWFLPKKSIGFTDASNAFEL